MLWWFTALIEVRCSSGGQIPVRRRPEGRAHLQRKASHEELRLVSTPTRNRRLNEILGPDRAGRRRAAAAGAGELYADRSLLQHRRRLRDRTSRAQLDRHGRRVSRRRHASDHRRRRLLPAAGAGPARATAGCRSRPAGSPTAKIDRACCCGSSSRPRPSRCCPAICCGVMRCRSQA